MSEFDDRPPRDGVALAGVIAAVAVLASFAGNLLGIALVAAGVASIVAGTAVGSRRLATGSLAVASLGFLLQAALGAGPVAPVLGLGMAVVTWDVGEYAIGLGEQVGRAARVRHAVLAHAAFGVAVAGTVVVAGVGLFWAAPGGRPVTALVFLLLATLLLPVALGE